jgi:hypothetical protein
MPPLRPCGKRWRTAAITSGRESVRATSASINWRSSSESLPIGSLISSAIARLAASGVAKLSSWNGSGSQTGEQALGPPRRLVRHRPRQHHPLRIERRAAAREAVPDRPPDRREPRACFCGAYGIGAVGSGRQPGDRDRTVPRPVQPRVPGRRGPTRPRPSRRPTRDRSTS